MGKAGTIFDNRLSFSTKMDQASGCGCMLLILVALVAVGFVVVRFGEPVLDFVSDVTGYFSSESEESVEVEPPESSNPKPAIEPRPSPQVDPHGADVDLKVCREVHAQLEAMLGRLRTVRQQGWHLREDGVSLQSWERYETDAKAELDLIARRLNRFRNEEPATSLRDSVELFSQMVEATGTGDRAQYESAKTSFTSTMIANRTDLK